MAKKEAQLIFGRNDHPEGFRTAGVSSYGAVDPTVIVRELIQNSLDAGSEAKRNVIKISFTTEKIRAKDIVGMDEYKKAFASATRLMKAKKNLDDEFVQAIKDNLDKGRVNALWVMDNGVGLDAERMTNLLGDGVSNTEDTLRGGSFGNGHITAFPSSDFRYIIYGGCREDKQKILSGHAILASHENEKGVLMGKDGVIKKEQGNLWMANFPDEHQIPKYWQEKLQTIERDYGAGSFVCILAFNNFHLSEEDASKSIFQTAAKHFMPAIHSGRLEVSLNSKTLTKNTIHEVLEQVKDKKRKRKNSADFAGWKAYDIYQTICHGEKIAVQLGKEKLSLYVRAQLDSGDTHIHLYRNGMWITDEVDYNDRSDFSDFQSFNAVIAVDTADAPDIFGLVRKTEGPTHMSMDMKKLSSSDKKSLEQALKKVREEIMKIAPKKESESMDSDFILLGKGSVGKITPIYRRPVNPRATGGGGGGGGNGERDGVRTKSVSRSGNAFDASSTLSRDGDNLHVSFKAHEDAQNIEVRIVLRSGSDLSCDDPEHDEFIAIAEGITLDDKIIPKDYYIDGDKGIKAAFHIGAIEAGETEHKLVIPCVSLPSSGSLDVELVRRAKIGESS